MSIGLSITLMLVCLFLSAFFSASETSFTSANKVRLKTLSQDGNKKAKRVVKIIEKYDKFLSAVLIGNNIVNISLSTISTLFFVQVLTNTSATDWAGTISTIVCTVVVLTFGEVLPKSVAKEYPERFAMLVAPIIEFVMIIFTPFCAFFSLLKKGISKMSKGDNNTETVTDDEILTMVDEAQSVGGIEESEGDLIRSAIEFIDRTAGEILTPRVDVVAAPISTSPDEMAKIISDSGYSRILIYEGTIDNIVGIIHEKDFYSEVYKKEKRNIKDVMKPPVFAVESIKISDLMKLLQKNKLHLAVITDEFGGTQGIVTMEDILEELVGEIYDETDELEEDVVQKSEDEYLVRGDADIDTLQEIFNVKTEDFDATTVGGFFSEITGRVPKEGAKAEYENLSITVMKVLKRRILELDIKVLPSIEEEDDED